MRHALLLAILLKAVLLFTALPDTRVAPDSCTAITTYAPYPDYLDDPDPQTERIC